MSKISSVARWEYLEKVKSKAFLLGLFLTPLLMVGMGVLPTLFVSQPDKESKVIGLIDQTGEFAPLFALRMQQRFTLPNGKPNYVVRVLASGTQIDLEKESADASAKVSANEIAGYCILPVSVMSDSVIEYRSTSVGDFRLAGNLREIIRGLVQERRAQALGVDPRLLTQLNVRLDVETIKLSKSGEKEEAGFERVFFSAYVFLMMLFFLIVTSGQLLVRSVIEEKSNRIVEVLVSSVSPTQLMAGKVLGLSMLGFTQIGFWALIGTAASLQFGISIVAPVQALLLFVYFVLGYLFYAAVFIGAGSPLNTEQEAQQVTSYLVILLILPIALALPAMQNPDALWIRILTYIPFLTPTMMALRIPIQMPSPVEILATVALMVIAIVTAMVAAGRIFRIGILSTGKSPKLSEILRWARAG